MAKTADTASLLESSRKALAQLEQEISALEVTRDERLLANEPTAKITAVDKELENSRRAAGIERDRIRLFEDRLDRDRSAARLGQRLERVQAVEQLLQT